jgi:SAM-dependent methyltransferase
VSDPAYRLEDRGDHRVLTVDGRPYRTHYSARVVDMLIARKGPRRAVLYFPFKNERAPTFLDPLFAYLASRSLSRLRVLEVGCSFGHITEYLAERPELDAIHAFDTDPDFVAIVRAKVEELGLRRVVEVLHLTGEATCHLPWRDGLFDLVIALGVVEHLPERLRRRQVDEYYRVLAPGGLIAILDTPNRLFPFETHTVGLPLVQWLPGPLAHRYAGLLRPGRFRNVSLAQFTADGTGWRNATFADCLPSAGARAVDDLTEEAGYGYGFLRNRIARSSRRHWLLRHVLRVAFGAAARALTAAGRPPSLGLPYLNLLFRKRPA